MNSRSQCSARRVILLGLRAAMMVIRQLLFSTQGGVMSRVVKAKDAVVARDLRKTYGAGESQVTALNNASIRVGVSKFWRSWDRQVRANPH